MLLFRHTKQTCKNVEDTTFNGKCFYVYYITHYYSEFCMDMNFLNPLGKCYDISTVALSKSVACLTDHKCLDVMIFTFLRTKFSKGPT